MKAYERSLRLFAAPFIFIYGFVKPWQFENAFSNTTAPTNELEGMSLMWAFFGYSTIVPIFVGIFECIGAVLLVFDRTKVLGALVLTPVLVNIVLFDLVYEVSTFPTMNGVIYLTIIFVVLWNERRRLATAFAVLQCRDNDSTAFETTPDSIEAEPAKPSFSLKRVLSLVGLLSLNWILFLLIHDVARRVLTWFR